MVTREVRAAHRVFALFAAFSLSGCTALVGALQDAISKHEIPVEVITVTTKLPEVVDCVEHPKGICTAPAGLEVTPLHIARDVCSAVRTHNIAPGSMAMRAICDPTATNLENLMNAAAGRHIEENVSLSRDGSRGFAKTLFDAANTHSWSQVYFSLNLRAQTLLTKSRTTSLSDTEVAEQRSVLQAMSLASTIEHYFNDYFLGGHFVSLTIDPADLTSSAEKELHDKLGLSSNSAKDAVSDVLNQLTGQSPGSDGKYHLVTAKSDDGFVTRGGNKYVFPTVAVNFAPGAKQAVNISKVDFPAIGADLMRVYVEAIGDYWAQLPGVSQASGVKVGLLRAYGVDPTKEQVKEDQFTEVNDWSSSAETAAAGGTGQLIRGIAWLSLNNEALAKVIETAVGVAVRKASEKVTWCVEACATVSDLNEFRNGAGTTTTTHVLIVE